jgi:hypothetical protein
VQDAIPLVFEESAMKINKFALGIASIPIAIFATTYLGYLFFGGIGALSGAVLVLSVILYFAVEDSL